MNDILQAYGVTRRIRKKKTEEDKPEPLTTDQEESLVGNLGRKAIGTVGAVGNLLDLPGSMVRDAVSLKNPLDQLLTPFNDSNRVSGRDLNRRLGLAGNTDTWANFGGGMATEVALDPLTYLTFGASALGKGGQVAKAAGLMPKAAGVYAKKTGRALAKTSDPVFKDILDAAGSVGKREAKAGTTLRDLVTAGGSDAMQAAENAAKGKGLDLNSILDEKLGGSVGIGLPFMDPMFTIGNSTKAGKLIDDLGGAIRYSKVPGTDFAPIHELTRLFDYKAQDMTTPLGRQLATKAFDDKTATRAKVKTEVAKLSNELQNLGLSDAAGGRHVRNMMEVEAARKTASPAEAAVLDEMDSRLKAIPGEANSWGVPLTKYVDDDLDYFPRQMTSDVRNNAGGGKSKPVNARHGAQLKRKEFLRGIPEGTDPIIAVGQDARINDLIDSGASRKDVANALENLFGARIPATYDYKIKSGANAGTVVQRNRYKAMAKWLGTLSPETRKSGIFGNHAVLDYQSRLIAAGDAITAAKTVVETITQPGILMAPNVAANTRGTMTVADLLDRTGLKMGTQDGGIGSQILKAQGIDITGMSKKQSDSILKSLSQHTIDERFGQDITRYMEAYSGPEPTTKMLDFIDNISNFWKGSLTTPWPAFHVRNLVSGQWDNVMAGMWSPQSVKDSLDAVRGNVVKDAKNIPSVKAEWARRTGLPASGSSPMLADDAAGLNPFEREMTSSTSPTAQSSDVWRPEVFDNISANHMNFNKQITSLQAEGVLKPTDADIIRLAFSGASEDGMSMLNIAKLNAVDTIEGGKAAGRWNWKVGDNGLLQFDIDIAKNIPANQSSLSVLLHELGHQAQWAYKQMPGNEWGGSDFDQLVNKAFKNGRLEEYMKGVHGEKLGDYLTNTFEEQFPQLFADSILRRKVPQGALGKIITDIRDWIVQFLERIKLTKPIPKPTLDRIDEIIDAMMGFDGKSMKKLAKKKEEEDLAKIAKIQQPDFSKGLFDRLNYKEGGDPNGKAFMASSSYPQLTDEEATTILGEMAAGHGVIGKFDSSDAMSVAGAVQDRTSHNLDDTLSGVLGGGRNNFSPQRIAKKAVGLEKGTNLNPVATRGVGGRMKSEFGPMAAGEEAGFAIETMNRFAPWIHQLRQGVDPAEAASKVGAVQVLYQNRYYSKTEQEILQRAFPFFKYSSRKLPYLLGQLVEHPGGLAAQTIRTMENAHDPATFTPDHVTESAAIPVQGTPFEALTGKIPEGHDRYVSGLGLSLENPLGYGPGLRGAGLEVMSQMNPFIKAPLEFATGQTFFQKTPSGGRPLGDLDPMTGRLLANLTGEEKPIKYPGGSAIDFLIGNSPLSRVVGTANMVTDQRRGVGERALNVLTGIKTKDVSPAAKDALERDILARAMKELGAKSFTRTYIPDDVKATMTPEELAQATQLEQLMDILARNAKERKEAKAVK